MVTGPFASANEAIAARDALLKPESGRAFSNSLEKIDAAAVNDLARGTPERAGINSVAGYEWIQALDCEWAPLTDDSTNTHGLVPDRGAGFEVVRSRWYAMGGIALLQPRTVRLLKQGVDLMMPASQRLW